MLRIRKISSLSAPPSMTSRLIKSFLNRNLIQDTPAEQNVIFKKTNTKAFIILQHYNSKLVIEQKAQQKRAFDKRAEIQKFSLNQQVLVRIQDFLNKNRKLATKFESPYKIIELYKNWAILAGKNGKLIKISNVSLKVPIRAQVRILE